MKLVVVVVLALVAVSFAVPVEEPSKILRSHFEQKPNGFDSGFETEDGIQRSDVGELKEVLDEEKKPHQVLVYRGSWSYTNPDGKPETVSYIADENGYRAEGESIPTPPPSRK